MYKVTKDSVAKVTEMQNRLTEAHSRVSESSKRLQESESERRKLEFSLQQAQVRAGYTVTLHCVVHDLLVNVLETPPLVIRHRPSFCYIGLGIASLFDRLFAYVTAWFPFTAPCCAVKGNCCEYTF